MVHRAPKCATRIGAHAATKPEKTFTRSVPKGTDALPARAYYRKKEVYRDSGETT
jgi:hypothetical protein